MAKMIQGAALHHHNQDQPRIYKAGQSDTGKTTCQQAQQPAKIQLAKVRPKTKYTDHKLTVENKTA